MDEAIFQIIAILKTIQVEILSVRTNDGLKTAMAQGIRAVENLEVIIR
jgi:hypothetical protein